MKRPVWLAAMMLTFALCFCALPARAAPQEIEGETRLQMGGYDLSVWEDAASSFSAEVQALWNGESMADWMEAYALGEMDTPYDTVFTGVGNALLQAVRANAGAMGAMLGVALLTGILGLVMDEAQGVREIIAYLCYGLALIGISTLFAKLMETTQNTITQLADFSEAAIPVLTAMLTATGSVTSAGMLRPLMAFLSGGVMRIFRSGVLSLIQAGAILAVAGNLSGRRELQRMSGLCRSLCKWTIGLVFTVFMGVISLQGMSAGTVDSIGIRTAKYTLDKTLPIVGGAVSGTLDTVRGCAILVKNASGAATVVLTLAYALGPAVQILAAAWAMRLCAALCEPVSDGRIAHMLGEMADLCNYLLSIVIVIALMFMIMAGLVMAIGNG